MSSLYYFIVKNGYISLIENGMKKEKGKGISLHVNNALYYYQYDYNNEDN